MSYFAVRITTHEVYIAHKAKQWHDRNITMITSNRILLVVPVFSPQPLNYKLISQTQIFSFSDYTKGYEVQAAAEGSLWHCFTSEGKGLTACLSGI